MMDAVYLIGVTTCNGRTSERRKDDAFKDIGIACGSALKCSLNLRKPRHHPAVIIGYPNRARVGSAERTRHTPRGKMEEMSSKTSPCGMGSITWLRFD